MAPFRDPCGFSIRSFPDDVPCGGRCLGMWTKAVIVAALGGDGTRGVSKFGLVNAIRTYRLVPQRVRIFLNRHPEPGSSAQGLAAAKLGLGVAGVLLALSNCGCSLRVSNCGGGGRHAPW